MRPGEDGAVDDGEDMSGDGVEESGSEMVTVMVSELCSSESTTTAETRVSWKRGERMEWW